MIFALPIRYNFLYFLLVCYKYRNFTSGQNFFFKKYPQALSVSSIFTVTHYTACCVILLPKISVSCVSLSCSTWSACTPSSTYKHCMERCVYGEATKCNIQSQITVRTISPIMQTTFLVLHYNILILYSTTLHIEL